MRPVRVAVAGSVDDGKSTLLGRLMNDAGRVFLDEVEAVRKATAQRELSPSPRGGEGRGEGSRGPVCAPATPGDALALDSARPDWERSSLNLAFFTDGLILERRDGITLDVAWRHLTLGTRRLLLADVPGHADLVRNMATGASTADAALLLVDAERGLQPQTRRHLVMLSGLGVRRVVVCINKMDAVGLEQAVAARLAAQLEALAAPLCVALEIIPVSALDGDNVVRRSDRMPWYAGPTVAQRLERLEPVPAGARTRAVVQLGSDEGGWTALHLLGGEVSVGEVLTAWPAGSSCKVLECSPHGAGRVRLEPGQQRGVLLCAPDQPPLVAAEATLIVTWLGPLECAAPLVLTVVQHGRATRARLEGPLERVSLETGALEAATALKPGDVCRARFVLEAPTWLDTWEDSPGTATCLLVDGQGRTVAGARFT